MFWRRICMAAVVLTIIAGYTIPINNVFAAINIQSFTNTSNEGNSLVLSNPGTTGGELLLAQITFNKPSQAGSDAYITPSGWTLLNRTNNLANSLGQAIFYKIAATGEPPSYTWNFAVGLKSAGGIIRATGIDTTNPIIDSSFAFSFTNPMTTPSINSQADSMLVVFYGIGDNSTISGPDGMAGIYAFQNASYLSIYAKYQTVPAGITGDKTANADPANYWIAHMVTLRAATPVSYTLTYIAGTNGSISGTSPQIVNQGASGSAVTAVPNSGYHFVDWSDGLTVNPRTDTNVQANISVTANFAINTYTLTYTAGAGGILNGNTTQQVPYGGNGSAVTAVPNANYHFVNWSDGSTDNPRTDTSVTANINVTANFAPDTVTYTLTYTAGANGSISGTSPQIVNQGASGSSVSAVPAFGYHFVNWSDSSTMNPRTDTNVQSDISVTANFAINTYTLTYTAGTNGTISGTSPQTVNHGTSGTAVTAMPASNYHFVNWSDSSTMNPRTDTNVQADINVTANFAQNTTVTFTLTYSAGTNGTISGTSPQTVNQGASGSVVTAIPNTGYHFVNWSDSSTMNPRTDTNVQADISVTANFAINTYTLTYTAGANGTISGTSPQTVNYGANGSTVTAVPATGYHFVRWSDSSTVNPRTDTNVQASVSVTANFAINTYTLTYTAGANGTISGTSPQTVNYGANGSAVTAVPATGYRFVNWSDGSTANPRTDSNVKSNINVTASFTVKKYTLTTNTEGSGSVLVNPSQADYNHGTTIQLTAEPADDWTFSNWNGDITGSENPVTVTMNNNMTVTAVFIHDAYTLTINVAGSGSVSRTPDQVSYIPGSSVQLTTTPVNGWIFSSWSGDLSGNENPISITMDNNKVITATFTQSSSGGGGNFGGMSGGGGGGGLTGPGITNLSVYIDSEGLFNLAATAKSEDEKVLLAIAKGVVAKDKDGKSLTTVSIKETIDTPPLPAKSTLIGKAYDFGPDGATFTPPISLTFVYDRNSLPEGLPEKNLTIVTWNAGSSTWEELGGTVDTANGTITITVSHFSQYTVIAHTRPASFVMDSLTVTPTEAATGETVTVTVVTTNAGDLPGEYTAALKVNGNLEATQKATIPGNGSTSLTFTITRDIPETYEIDVNGKTTLLTIKVPPTAAELIIKSLKVSPGETTYGEEITISVFAENNGDFALQDTLELKIDGVVIDTRAVDIAPHSTETIVFTAADIEPGSRTIDIDGQQANFIVKPLLSPKVKATINWYLIALLVFLMTAGTSTFGFYLKLKPREIPIIPPRIKKDED